MIIYHMHIWNSQRNEVENDNKIWIKAFEKKESISIERGGFKTNYY